MIEKGNFLKHLGKVFKDLDQTRNNLGLFSTENLEKQASDKFKCNGCEVSEKFKAYRLHWDTIFLDLYDTEPQLIS